MTSPVRKAAIGIFAAVFALAVTGSTIAPVSAADQGVTDTEIVLGGTHPYSGPASAYGNIGKGIGAYFSYVNDRGGVNGRKIKYIDKDDGYSPPQAVQLVHQMVVIETGQTRVAARMGMKADTAALHVEDFFRIQ